MRKVILTVLTVLLFTGGLLFFMQPAHQVLAQESLVAQAEPNGSGGPSDWGIIINPRALEFTATVGSTVTQEIVYSVSNTGAETASWTPTMFSDRPTCWGSIGGPGRLAPGHSFIHLYTVSGQCFTAPGTYTRTLVLTEAAAPGQPPIENPRTVSMTIQANLLAPAPKWLVSVETPQVGLAGQVVTWTAYVTNTGILVQDLNGVFDIGLPIAEVTGVTTYGQVGITAVSGGTQVTWLGQMSPGQVSKLVITGRVPADVQDSLASVSWLVNGVDGLQQLLLKALLKTFLPLINR